MTGNTTNDSTLKPQEPNVSDSNVSQVAGCLEVALSYLSKEYSVIPIDGRTKKPMIRWEEFQNRLPTIAEVEQWYKQWPEASIAIITGRISRLVVFDIDPRNGGRPEPYKKHNTAESKTGGGGNHFFFNYPNFDVPTIPSITPGVDLKSEGGYVIVPPSTHPTGNKYEWVKHIFNKPLDLPEELINLINNHGINKSNFDSTLLEGVSEGARNESAASVIGKILHGLQEKDWEATGWQLITGWNLKNDPPLEERELRSVFESIGKRELLTRTSISPQESLEKEMAESKRFDFVSWRSLLDKDFKDEEWLIKGLLRKGWLGVIGGHGKQGKTTLAVHLLNHIRQGKDFFSKTQKLPVLYINYEMGEFDTRNLIKDISNNEGDFSNTYIINYPPVPLSLDLLKEKLTKIEPGVCVIDSFRGAFLLERDFENHSGEVGTRLRKLQLIARETKWTIILIHHFKKSGTGEALDLAGSGEWLSAPDVVMTWVCPNLKEPGKLEVVGRIPPLDPLSIKLSRESIEFLGTVAENQIKEERKRVLSELSEEPQKSKDIATSLELPDATVRKRLGELFKDGLASRDGVGVRGNPYLWKKSTFEIAKEIFVVEDTDNE